MELKTVSKDRQDIDLAAFTYNDAKYIRKEIQVNNEELYYLYIYMNVFSKDKKELEYSLNKIEGLCQAKGIITKRAYFRQEEAFISCSPCMENKNILKQVSRRNILTNGLIATYPFISSSIFDEEGIFIGTSIYNNSLIFIDRYNKEKYKNANMCIFGTSGAGKSYYTKLMILRYRLFGIYQYIIDPDREYENLCKALKGTIIKIGPSFNTYINIFDIREDSIEDKGKGFLATKIPKLIAFFNLIFGEMNEEEKGILEEKIIDVYKKKGITFDDNTLYKKEKNKNKTKLIFKRSKDMPILEDLFNLLEKKPEYYKATELLGDILIAKEMYKEAVNIYQNALRYNPTSYEINYNLGIAYTMLNDFQNARVCYEKAAELNSLLYNAKYSLAEIALIYKELEEAEKYFMQAVEDEELAADSYYELSKISMIKGDKDTAIKFANIAIDIDSEKIVPKIKSDPIFIPIMTKMAIPFNLQKAQVKEKLEEKEIKAKTHLEDMFEITRNLSYDDIRLLKKNKENKESGKNINIEKEQKERQE